MFENNQVRCDMHFSVTQYNTIRLEFSTITRMLEMVLNQMSHKKIFLQQKNSLPQMSYSLTSAEEGRSFLISAKEAT